MVKWSASIPEAAVGLVWCISFIAVLWRYAGPATAGTAPFLIGTGVSLCVLQVFAALMLCLFKWTRNPPFGFVWVYLSLVLSGFVVHIAVLGADLARITLSSESVPFNTVEYDIAIVVCQAIFISGVFCLAFNVGSHSTPPPWAHPNRSSASSRASRHHRGELDVELTNREGVEYALAGDDATHTIGLDDESA